MGHGNYPLTRLDRAREFGREVATAQRAREISQIGAFYYGAEAVLLAEGFAPNRNDGSRGCLRKTH